VIKKRLFYRRDGRVAQLENIYVRGSKIRFLILPDMLKNAPMLKNMATRGRGTGSGDRGKSAILRNQANAGGRGRGFGDRGGRGGGRGGDRGGRGGGFGDRGGRGGYRGDRH
jgi:small nuclear ribonucleoprotein D3